MVTRGKLDVDLKRDSKPAFGESGLEYTFDLAEFESGSLEYSSTGQGEVLGSD